MYIRKPPIIKLARDQRLLPGCWGSARGAQKNADIDREANLVIMSIRFSGGSLSQMWILRSVTVPNIFVGNHASDQPTVPRLFSLSHLNCLTGYKIFSQRKKRDPFSFVLF